MVMKVVGIGGFAATAVGSSLWSARSRPHSRRRSSVRYAALLLGALLAPLAAGCGADDGDRLVAVTGVLPDGTRYELRIPAGLDVNSVEDVGAGIVWASGSADEVGNAVGVIRFARADSSLQVAPGTTAVIDNRLIAHGGVWAMIIDLYGLSAGREVDLERIGAREQDGLIVLDLPNSLRFAETGELPLEMEVTYRDLRVVRGCSELGRCSPDRRIMVVPVSPQDGPNSSVNLGDVEVRILPTHG